MTARIVVVGSYGVGLTLTVDRAPRAGETVVGHAFSSGPGGKGSNQAIAAARLGADVDLVTVVGTDDYGRAAHALWHAEGVGTAGVQTLGGTTMVGVILVEGNGENRIAIAPGVLADMTIAELDGLEALVCDASVVLVSLEIPVDVAYEALRRARAAGVPTVLNPAPAPSGALPAGMLDLVDHLTPNRTEAAALSSLPTSTDAHDLIHADCFAPVTNLVITLGDEGALLRTPDGVERLPAARVPVVDSTGAGDTFSAAYAVEIALGARPVDAARFATVAAALCVTRAEVVPSLPRRSDVDQFSLREGAR